MKVSIVLFFCVVAKGEFLYLLEWTNVWPTNLDNLVTSDDCTNHSETKVTNTRSQVTKSQCFRSTMTDCTIDGSNLTRTTCTNSQFVDVKSTYTTTTGSRLVGVRINNAIITGSRISLKGSGQCTVSHCTMNRGVPSSDCQISGCDYGPAWVTRSWNRFLNIINQRMLVLI